MTDSAPAPLRATSGTALVPAPPPQVWRAIEDLSAQLWDTRVVADEQHRLLILAVADGPDGGPQCWLTWTLTPTATAATRVDVSCSEEADAAPPAELDALLLQLLAACLPQFSSPA